MEAAPLRYAVDGMTCAACASRLTRVLERVPGAADVRVSLITAEAVVGGTASEAEIFEATRRAGFVPTHREGRGLVRVETGVDWRLWVSLALSLPLTVLGMRHIHSAPALVAQLVLSTVVLVLSGGPYIQNAVRLARNRDANMDSLISIGVLSAWSVSVWTWVSGGHEVFFEVVGVVLTFVRLGKWLEGRARQRAGAAMGGLVALVPSTAARLSGEQEARIDVDELVVGDRVLVRPGERIPVDGVVVDGESAVDEAVVTGEALPVRRGRGSVVMAGTLVHEGRLVVEASRAGAGTVVARMIELTRRTQAQKAPAERLADRVSAVFVPGVLAVSIVTFAVHLGLGHGLAGSVLPAVAVLVVACPCALGLATPIAVYVGTTRAAELGVLVRDLAALESSRRVDTLVVDKTGTLTLGRPEVVSVAVVDGFEEQKLRQVVASVERLSEHPLGRALVQGWSGALFVVPTFQAPAGRGAVAVVEAPEGPVTVHVGGAALLMEAGISRDVLDGVATDAGGVRVEVAVDGRAAGVFVLRDALRPESAATVAALRRRGVRVILATGDQPGPANEVAAAVGIEEVHSACLPTDKARLVETLRSAGAVVAMVGDGVNDAAALAAADVSIAVGGGTDAASEVAGLTLIGGDISRVLSAMDIAIATSTTIRQNLGWAFVFNVLALPLAASGRLSPMLASALMSGSSVAVVANALRLLRSGGRPRAELPAKT